jgi:hypothetical protein
VADWVLDVCGELWVLERWCLWPPSSDLDVASCSLVDAVTRAVAVDEAAFAAVPASARWPVMAAAATVLAAAAAMRERRAGCRRRGSVGESMPAWSAANLRDRCERDPSLWRGALPATSQDRPIRLPDRPPTMTA